LEVNDEGTVAAMATLIESRLDAVSEPEIHETKKLVFDRHSEFW
jgi:hypothetical protein